MGLTNVIMRTADRHHNLSYTCVDEMLPIEAGAIIECAGDCRSCRCSREDRSLNGVNRIPIGDVDDDGNCRLIGYLTLATDLCSADEVAINNSALTLPRTDQIDEEMCDGKIRRMEHCDSTAPK